MKNVTFGVLLAMVCGCAANRVNAENWPQFRGPTGQGLSTEKSPPVKWSATENIAWKAEVPGEGWSSPIIWGDSVFVTTALENGESLHLLCFDLNDGRVRWNQKVLQQSIQGRKEGRNIFATPTPATDGEKVYVVGFDGTFAAIDFGGNTAWTNRDYPFYGQHGLGTSLLVYNGKLIMARDGSSDGENKKLGWQEPWDKSFIVALDGRTGKQVWKSGRGLSRIGHVTPLVATNSEGKPVLLSGAGDVVQCFDPANGRKIWSATNKGEGVVPSPAAGDGLVFTACGFSGRDSLKAFRVDSQGDSDGSNMAWEQRKGMPRVPSLLYVSPRLFVVGDTGASLCLDGRTGEVLWQTKLDGNFGASPVYAAGKVYFLNDEGETTVMEVGPEPRVIARNNLSEKC